MICKPARRRIIILALCLLTLFSLLIYRFYTLQVIEGEKWSRLADRQHYFVVREPFLRGSFYTSNSLKIDSGDEALKLVTEIQKFHLYIDPKSLPDDKKDKIASTLIQQLHIPKEEQQKFLTQFKHRSRSRKLAVWLDSSQKQSILDWWQPYARKNRIPSNALYFVADYKRSYPYGKLMGQLLHTVQEFKDEKTLQAIPTGGLELQFNKFLQGKEGRRRLMRSPRNSLETGEVLMEPENGADIYLTINHYLQAITEEELEKGVKQCKAKRGWAVMMQPHTGEVLAMAQYPFFNPEYCQEYFNDPVKCDDTRLAAATDANEPGSIMKAFTASIALLANKELKERGEKPLFDPEEKICTSDHCFPGRKPLKDLTLHNYLNMDMAIWKSSNVYSARLAQRIIDRMGADWYKKVLHNVFGFGEKTGIELPYENPGLVPTPGKKHPNGALEWSVATPFSMAMGHNIQASALQLARAFCIFANGGYLVQPTLVKKIVKDNEVLLDNSLRYQQFPKVFDPKISEQVVNSMKYATKAGGCSRRADINGFTESGKSGTAEKIINGQYSKTLNCSSFVGFAPCDNPAFVLIVTMDEPEHRYIPGVGKNQLGGTCAAPVFREIGRRTLEYLGEAPDDPYGYPAGDPRRNPAKADWVEETRRLQEKYEKWNKSK